MAKLNEMYDATTLLQLDSLILVHFALFLSPSSRMYLLFYFQTVLPQQQGCPQIVNGPFNCEFASMQFNVCKVTSIEHVQ